MKPTVFMALLGTLLYALGCAQPHTCKDKQVESNSQTDPLSRRFVPGDKWVKLTSIDNNGINLFVPGAREGVLESIKVHLIGVRLTDPQAFSAIKGVATNHEYWRLELREAIGGQRASDSCAVVWFQEPRTSSAAIVDPDGVHQWTSVNELLLVLGLAVVRPEELDEGRLEAFRRSEEYARTRKRGIWR